MKPIAPALPALRIAFVTSELAPFAKAGGLADVSAALPAYLDRAGHDVRPFVPLYQSINWDRYGLTPVEGCQGIGIRMGEATFTVDLMTGRLPGSTLDVYFVHCPPLFGRPGIYTSDPDEHRRFLLLSRAAIECLQRMGFSPDILHVHDWATALVPLYLKTVYAWDKLFAATRTVLTIHNIGYQGTFGTEILKDLNPIGTQYFDGDDLKNGRVNLLKTGLVHAHQLTTVSPTYAREIQTPEFGYGLDGILRMRSENLEGILNGVDYEAWNPETDPHLPAHYGPADLSGKGVCKEALLSAVGLAPTSQAPVVGIVSRLAHQKGLDLLFEPIPALLQRREFRFVVLGNGEPKYEEFFGNLVSRFPGRAAFYSGYHEKLAHLIEAGSDFFVMPSRYEPCGLNQMYSLKYGTIPVVRKTGGLADTVTMYDPATGRGNGVVFEHFTAEGAYWALDTAMNLYGEPRHRERMIRNGMAADFSWETEGARYVALYRRLVGGANRG
ncbi:MAG TPA: glycogen synthase GlgA [Candidatus Eisenbacteria bacterium]